MPLTPSTDPPDRSPGLSCSFDSRAHFLFFSSKSSMQKLNRRAMLALIASGALPIAHSQTPVLARQGKIVVPFAPGGTSDLVARLIAEASEPFLGQRLIVDNKPGAGAIMGSNYVAQQPADGSTLVLIDMTHAIGPAIQAAAGRTLPYHPLDSFTPITQVASSPQTLLVRADSPFKTAAEFIAVARAKPGAIKIGNGGLGTGTHLMGELLQIRTGAEFLHVPYKGVAPAIPDLMGGVIDAVFAPVATTGPFHEGGKARILALTTAQRTKTLPEVQTFKENGIDLVALHWFGLAGPAGIRPELVKQIGEAFQAAGAQDAFQEKLRKQGLIANIAGPEAFRRLIGEELVRWKQVVEQAKISVNA